MAEPYRERPREEPDEERKERKRREAELDAANMMEHLRRRNPETPDSSSLEQARSSESKGQEGGQPRKPRVVRVEMTWDNGKIMFLEGEEADQWVKTADASVAYARGHGVSFPSSYWRTKPAPDS